MEELLNILQELHPEIDFEQHSALVDEGVFNSFDIIAIIGQIDEVFDVAVPAEEIVPENFNSAQSLYAMVRRLEEEG